MKKCIFLLLFLLVPYVSNAQTDYSFDIVDQIRNEINNNASNWAKIIKDYAVKLFFALAGIGFISKFIMDIMTKGEVDTKESISYIVKFTISTGFFYFLLDNGISLAHSIVQSLTKIGEEAVGLKPNFTNLLSVGFDLIASGDSIGWRNFEIKIPFFILAVLTTVFLLIIMANLVIEEVAAAIMIYVGFFVLALGGMDYTRESAINYFKAIFGVSLKILTIILIMAVTISIVGSLVNDLKINQNIKEGSILINQALIAFLTVFFLALLSLKLPDAVANLVSSAWGNMSGITLMGGIAIASNVAQKASNSISSTIGGAKNAVTGYKDYQKNKEIMSKKKEAEAKGEDTSLNPMYNKQQNASGKAYYGGKAVAAGVDAYNSVSNKLGNIFGNKNNTPEETQDNNSGDVNENKTEDNKTQQQCDTTPTTSSNEKNSEIKTPSENIENNNEEKKND